jgi:hypothetical protein
MPWTRHLSTGTIRWRFFDPEKIVIICTISVALSSHFALSLAASSARPAHRKKRLPNITEENLP